MNTLTIEPNIESVDTDTADAVRRIGVDKLLARYTDEDHAITMQRMLDEVDDLEARAEADQWQQELDDTQRELEDAERERHAAKVGDDWDL